MKKGFFNLIAAFTLLNLVGEMVHRGFDASIWWIDLRMLPLSVGHGLLLSLVVAMLDFALCPECRGGRRWLRAAVTFTFLLLSLNDAVRFLLLVHRGDISSSFEFPVSLAVAVSFATVLWTVLRPTHCSSGRSQSDTQRERLLGGATFGACLVMFPLLQMHCFGWTDYRRPADVAVVFGCRVFPDGSLSLALADRVRSGVELYRQGYCRYLIMSGGPGPGDIHETEAMKRYATELGVPAERILTDRLGLSTDETVTHTMPLLNEYRFDRVLAVSHYYHLPRIKLAYARAGQEVFTVPATQTRRLWKQELLLVREVVALWAYYARPLTGL